MRWAMLGFVLLSMSGCAAGDPYVELRGERFMVEIADDPQEQARGLMYRDSMPGNHGMLFLFDREEPQAFWMKNTKIPLDILYFDSNWKLVGWSLNTPPCAQSASAAACPSYPSGQPAKYVLELNGGTAERLGAQFGDTLKVAGLP
jgi:hypothetical protein